MASRTKQKIKKCAICGTQLSQYNKGRICFHHSEKNGGLTTAEWYDGAAKGQGNPGGRAEQTDIRYNGK